MTKKEILNRALKTFIQGFLASFLAFMGNNTTFDEKMLKSAFIGALAGGISALMNFVLKLLEKGGENMEEEKVVEAEVIEEQPVEEVEEATEEVKEAE